MIASVDRASAQSLDWAMCGGPTAWNGVMDLAYDANGDLFVGGAVGEGAFDIAPGPDTLVVQSIDSQDLLLAKYSSSGTLLWAHVLGDTLSQDIRTVAPDGVGGVVVAGLYVGDFDIDPGPGVNVLSTPGGYPWNTTFLARFDANGDLQWAFSLGAAWAYVFPDAVALDAEGNVILVGSLDTNTGSGVDMDPGPAAHTLATQDEDIYVAKYSPSGAYQWAFTIGGIEDFERGLGVACDGNDNVYLTGNVHSTGIDADPGPGQYLVDAVNTHKYMLLASYAPGGTFRWAFTVGVPQVWSGLEPFDITVDGDDNLIVTGDLAGTNIDFDPSADTAFIHHSTAGATTFMAKYTATGALLWCQKLEPLGILPGTIGNRGRSIACTPANEIVVAGDLTNDTLDVDPSPGTHYLQRIGSVADTYVAQYDPNGGFMSAFNISSSTQASPFTVACSNSGGLAVGGTYGGVGFDPDPWTTGPTYDAGITSLWLAVYQDIATGIALTEPVIDGLTIVPNPGCWDGPVRITAPTALSEVRVISMNGCLSRTIRGEGGTALIDPSELTPGLYVIRAITRAGAMLTGKLVIEAVR